MIGQRSSAEAKPAERGCTAKHRLLHRVWGRCAVRLEPRGEGDFISSGESMNLHTAISILFAFRPRPYPEVSFSLMV